MKKILFVLGMIFSVYSFAEQGFSITESDTYQQVSKNPIFKLIDPVTKRFEFHAKPNNIFGVLVNDQNLEFGSVSFDEMGRICGAFIQVNGNTGFAVMLDRLKVSSEKNVKIIEIVKNQAYGLEDNSRHVLINYTQLNNFFIVDIRPKGVECIPVED